MTARGAGGHVAFAFVGAVMMSCAGATSSMRPTLPDGVAENGRLTGPMAEALLRSATTDLNRAFTSEGAEGLLRLRLRPADARAMFTDDALHRIERLPVGLSPAPGEQRWRMFRVFANAPVVGFCARGARVVDPNGPDGLRARAVVVDRLLIIGGEDGGNWGAWVEGVVLTNEGWRLMPTVPFERQVETPRRDHTDVQLWDCDLGQRPERSSSSVPSVVRAN